MVGSLLRRPTPQTTHTHNLRTKTILQKWKYRQPLPPPPPPTKQPIAITHTNRTQKPSAHPLLPSIPKQSHTTNQNLSTNTHTTLQFHGPRTHQHPILQLSRQNKTVATPWKIKKNKFPTTSTTTPRRTLKYSPTITTLLRKLQNQ